MSETSWLSSYHSSIFTGSCGRYSELWLRLAALALRGVGILKCPDMTSPRDDASAIARHRRISSKLCVDALAVNTSQSECSIDLTAWPLQTFRIIRAPG